MANAFLFDPNRCTGCHACRLACTIENQLAPGTSWRRIDTFNPRHHPELPLYHLSLACNHCAEPACLYACPALAYSRDAATGAVLLDPEKCIGCRYCAWACPYDAPSFDEAQGVMTKCTFCNHRLQEGLEPACAALCPTGALSFGDARAEGLAQEVEGFPRTDLEPRIRIDALKPDRELPLMTAPPVEVPFVEPPQPEAAGISLRSEWSLMLFTLLAAILVALLATSVSTGLAVNPLAFAGAAVLTLGLGATHLGQKERAYRAILNLRRSWLSREILVLSTFFAAGTAALWSVPGARGIGIAAALIGFLGLHCIDRVYGVLRGTAPGHLHSAGVLWMGFFLTGVFAGRAWLAAVFGVGRLLLYLLRKTAFREAGKPVRPLLGAARVGLGFVLPLLLWWVDAEALRAPLLASLLLGELVDRCEFYLELERPSPRRRMAEVLQQRVEGAPSGA
jgi:DMSO reductase iron-sulfur subunit